MPLPVKHLEEKLILSLPKLVERSTKRALRATLKMKSVSVLLQQVVPEGLVLEVWVLARLEAQPVVAALSEEQEELELELVELVRERHRRVAIRVPKGLRVEVEDRRQRGPTRLAVNSESCRRLRFLPIVHVFAQ